MKKEHQLDLCNCPLKYGDPSLKLDQEKLEKESMEKDTPEITEVQTKETERVKENIQRKHLR